jgi:hypothetical protein
MEIDKNKRHDHPIKIYVLTRTSGRKNFFHECFDSVISQTYDNICHMVCYDDPASGEYVKKYHEISGLGDRFKSYQVAKVKREGGNHFPYNLYLNYLMDQIDRESNGWIMFLDDDDVLANDHAVETIVKNILNETRRSDIRNRMLLWRVKFPPDRLVPRRVGGNRVPRIGDVSMIGFAFHVSWKDKIRFSDRKGGDHQFIRTLWNDLGLKPIWIDEILSKVNYENVRRIGSGLRNDLKFKNVQNSEYKKYWDIKLSMVKPRISIKKKSDDLPSATVTKKLTLKKGANANNTNNNMNASKSQSNSLVLDGGDDDSHSFEGSFDSTGPNGRNVLQDVKMDDDLNDLLDQDQMDHHVIDHGSHSTDDDDGDLDEFQPNEQDDPDADIDDKHVQVIKTGAKRLAFKERPVTQTTQKLVINNVSVKKTDEPRINLKKLAEQKDKAADEVDLDDDQAADEEDLDDEGADDEGADEEVDEGGDDGVDEGADEEVDEGGDDGVDEGEDEDLVIHPTIEKLCDLLSAEGKVNVLALRDLQTEIRACVREAVREAFSEMVGGGNGTGNRAVNGSNLAKITSNVPLATNSVAKSRPVAVKSGGSGATVMPKSKMNIRERRALRMKQLKEEKLAKRAARVAKSRGGMNRNDGGLNNSRNDDELSMTMSQVSQSSVLAGKKKSLKSQLSELMSQDASEFDLDQEDHDEDTKLGNLLNNYAQDGDRDEEEDDEDVGTNGDSGSKKVSFDQIDSFLDRVYIMNFEGHATELQRKLQEFGFTDVQIIEPNKRKDFLINVFDLLKANSSKKSAFKKVAIFKDFVHFNKNFAGEFLHQFSLIQQKKDWKMIALGASQNLLGETGGFDWKFYLQSYPDLVKSNIKDEGAASKHWKVYGLREKRFGLRTLANPETLAGLCGVIVNERMYADLSKLQKARDPREFILKNYKSNVYACSPLLCLPGMNRMIKMRNRHNLDFYDINA